MSESKFIDKHLELPKGMDYEFLKKEGIRKIQQLAGDNWTDFNEHDPGVTILEQLAYALSDLGYRSQLDFKDLYASQQNKSGNNTFYTAGKILPTNPITPRDIRKMIIDQVQGIQNAWIYPMNSFTRRKNIQGLFLVFIEKSASAEKSSEEIKKEVKDLLNYSHNLGETFEDVVILKQKEIFLTTSIELEKNAVPERVHAQVIFTLKQLISNPINYYSLNQMLDMGHPVESIFDGPPLKNGFILNEDLKEKTSIFYNSQMVNHLREISGVKTIKSLNLIEPNVNEAGEISYNDYFDDLSNAFRTEIAVIPWDSIGVLSEELEKNANNSDFFNYTSDGIKINLYQKEVDRYLKELNASTKQKTSQNVNQKNDFQAPQGKRLTINNYRSIQHEFPSIYGLGANAISKNTSPQRKAQIFQLKGFLLFFEQILSNYLAQLSRFNELYSLDKEVSSSYFVQVPWDIPGIYQLIKKTEETDGQTQEQLIQQTVEKIMDNIDKFHERRAKFLTHLLIRFGDDSHTHNFERFNYYHSEKEHRQNLLNQEIDILANYPALSKDKARSFNHTQPLWKEEGDESFQVNLSGLESRIRIMLGIPQELTRIGEFLFPKVKFDGKSKYVVFYQLFEPANLQIDISENEPKGLWTFEKKFEFTKNFDAIQGIPIDEDVFKRALYLDNLKVIQGHESNQFHVLFRRKVQSPPPEVRELLQKMNEIQGDNAEAKLQLFRNAKLESVLDGEHLKQNLLRLYRMLNEAGNAQSHENSFYVYLNGSGRLKYVVQFDRNVQNRFTLQPSAVYEILKTYSDEQTAFECGFSLRNIVLEWNKNSESLYILDHVLLRPRFKELELEVNILLNDPNSSWSFRLMRGHSVNNIETGLREDIKKIRTLKPEIVPKKDQYLIVWREGTQVIGRSTEKFPTVKKAKEIANEMEVYFQEFSNLDIHDLNRVKFKREYENEGTLKHPMFHYSFTLTIFLPNWTARFSDKEFQYYLESLIRKHTPAHIGVHFKWIDLKSFTEFETMYSLWLDENRKDDINFDILNQLSEELLSFAKGVKSIE